MPISRLKMNRKLISTLVVIFVMVAPYVSTAHEIPKPSFTIGVSLINDKALDGLAGTGVTI